MNKKGKPKGSKTNWELIILLVRNPLSKTLDLKNMGFNPYTIRKYRKNIQIAEQSILNRLKK